MKSEATRRIALVQAAYDLEAGPHDWLSNLLDAGGDLLDRGRGCTAAVWAGTSNEGAPLVSHLHATAGDRAMASHFARAAVRALGNGDPSTVKSDVYTLASPSFTRAALADTNGLGCADMLLLWAVDADFQGIGICIPSDSPVVISAQARQQWRKLLVHIAAGHRLRKQLGHKEKAVPLGECVQQADDALVMQGPAVGDSGNSAALRAIREAAVNLDATRVGLRTARREQALDIGRGVVDGSCSIIDWFDTDDRRFILARPNASNALDPRGLTEREYQVARAIGTGESCKLIAYTLGLSKSRVSALLHGAMRKLGVRTREQLVLTMRTLLVSGPANG